VSAAGFLSLADYRSPKSPGLKSYLPGAKSTEEQQALLKDPLFMSLYKASFIGFQYTCFNCIAVCPIGLRR
jgi:hypothetical protein